MCVDRDMKTIFSATAVLAALVVVPAAASPASAGGPTCRGREVTHVGTPGANLTTTPGADVVITNGAHAVRTLNGDDVICVTRRDDVFVVPGGGDDLVDATAYPGDSMETSLGQRQAAGSSGDDIYLGGGQTDIVFVSAGVAADHKDIHLDGGEDELYVDSNYRGAATAKLGVGADHYWTERPRPGVRVNAEEGRDHFVSKCGGCRVLKVRLGTGAIEVNGSPAGAADRFEDIDLARYAGRAIRNAVIFGTRGPNRMTVIACHAIGDGLGGDDAIVVGALAGDGCGRITGVANGEQGDDSLTGLDGNDYLRGGVGEDDADGGPGRDLCRAEVRTNCER